MKKILIYILILSNLFGLQKLNFNNSFISPDKAFIPKVTLNDNILLIDIKLAKNVYIYKDKFQLIINNTKITPQLPLSKKLHNQNVYFNNLKFKYIINNFSNKIKVKLIYSGCSTDGLCYPPITKQYQFTIKSSQSKQIISKPINESDNITLTLKNKSFFVIIATFFGFGLLLALTPCIFPMIPILSSIIVSQAQKDGQNNKSMSASRGFFISLVYVFSMAIAYTIAGVLAGLFGANLQATLQNPYVLIVFSMVFIVLAFSLFGYYSIELPQSLQNKINRLNNKQSGLIGVAIMGFLSALIVGPCVAPPLAGALVYIGQTGDAFLGGISLFVMSLGMGMPLLLVGIGAGKYMPKPGGWMQNISQIFGVIMLALAIWMLDRVLPRVVIMYLLSFLFIGSALYLDIFAPLDKNRPKILYIIKLFGIILFLYGVILFIGAVSKATDPFNPLEKFISKKIINNDSSLKFEHVNTIDELKDILNSSKRPIMIDFSAKWCVSCKELANITFKDDRVIKLLSKYRLIKIDITNNSDEDKKLLKYFNLFGPPALIFFKNGKEIVSKKIIGYKAPEEFLKIVR